MMEGTGGILNMTLMRENECGIANIGICAVAAEYSYTSRAGSLTFVHPLFFHSFFGHVAFVEEYNNHSSYRTYDLSRFGGQYRSFDLNRIASLSWSLHR